MRHFAPLLMVLFIPANISATEPTLPSVNGGRSDLEIVADRHLALYRAARFARESGSPTADRVETDGGDATAAIVRTTGTAALPLPLVFPVSLSTERGQ